MMLNSDSLSLPLCLSDVPLPLPRLRFGSRTNAQSIRRLWSTAQVDLKESTSMRSPLHHPVPPECHHCGTFPWRTKEPPCILADIWTHSVPGTQVTTRTLFPGLKWCDKDWSLSPESVSCSISAVTSERVTAHKNVDAHPFLSVSIFFPPDIYPCRNDPVWSL